MLKCKEVAEIVSKQLDTDLPWRVSWQIKLHFIVCKNCYRYYRQLAFLARALKGSASSPPDVALSEQAKQRIMTALNNKRPPPSSH